MARSDSRLDTWQVLLTISMVIIPLSAHGRHSLSRHHHHHNQSSVNKEALNARMVLSDDSAERDHLIGLGAKLPLSSTKHHHSHKHAHLDVVDEDPPVGEELTAGGAGPDQPGNPMSDEVITVEFHSPAPDVVPADAALDWAKAPQPQKQKGGDPTAWTLSDFYDYLSPDNDPSALDATPEPEPTPSPPPDMEDENPLLAGSPAVPDNVRPDVEPSIPAPSMPAPDTGDGVTLIPISASMEEFCTVVAGMGAFCRCNVQEYIWNKGTRCDWAITEFQVMCVLVGVASVVLIFLFMIIVCFAKKLHRLKNENNRLRKRRLNTRPQSSEPQTDGLSVSTMADGSQPNDDPQKQEDPAKSAQAKEEGSMNILNSHSPKHENNRPTSVAHDPGHTPNNTEENAEDGVTIDLEVLLPKEAKLHSETDSPLQYDVFLYKVPNSEDSTSPIHAPPTQSGNSYSSSHPMPKSPKTPKTPKVHKSPKHSREHSHSSREALPRGRSQALGSERSGTGREQGGHLHPSPSSPHLTQPSPSPSRVKCSPVSTRSLPVLS
ncbi:hypothetical protein KUCAC02_011441 [Chaenocephalus aceratus]|uniref:Uncharacterized protein n=1 Tax=Chaenocephalus aceratus TaxID=36190 RepID=A0ACB9WWX9_CHAAC|nr:hypothetical protein KUCAC02_011441 [Chaenocephalus aceratus]